MAFEKTKIRTVSKPTIVLEDMDTDKEATSLTFAQGFTTNKIMGYEFPYVIINEYRFKKQEISSLEIDCSNFLPILYMKVLVANNEFLSHAFPSKPPLSLHCECIMILNGGPATNPYWEQAPMPTRSDRIRKDVLELS